MNDKTPPKKTLTLNRKPPTGTPTSTGTPPTTTIQRTGKKVVIKRDASSYPAKPNRNAKPRNKPKPKPRAKKKAYKPSDDKVKELNDRLNVYPVWLNYQPLAIGIERELHQLFSTEHFPGSSKRNVQRLLQKHTNHGRYLQALTVGGSRYHLNGEDSGDGINAYEKQRATDTINERLKANAKPA
jgi:hypothetical protein